MAHKDTVSYDDLAEMFGIDSLGDLHEANWEYVAGQGDHAYEHVLAEGESEEEAEEEAEAAREQAEYEASDELTDKWKAGVEAAAGHEFDEHGLRLVEKGDWEFRIVPEKSWRDAAERIIDTINGVGYFYFPSVSEFVRSTSSSGPKEAVLSHLHWLKDRAEVYGDERPQRRYERVWR